ncbi:hypothetical protein EDD11_001771, partial [Mortierella claussenii]
QSDIGLEEDINSKDIALQEGKEKSLKGRAERAALFEIDRILKEAGSGSEKFTRMPQDVEIVDDDPMEIDAGALEEQTQQDIEKFNNDQRAAFDKIDQA